MGTLVELRASPKSQEEAPAAFLATAQKPNVYMRPRSSEGHMCIGTHIFALQTAKPDTQSIL